RPIGERSRGSKGPTTSLRGCGAPGNPDLTTVGITWPTHQCSARCPSLAKFAQEFEARRWVDGSEFRAIWLFGRSARCAARGAPLVPQRHSSRRRFRAAERIIDGSECRAKPGARLVRPFALESVLERPLDCPGGHGGADHLFDLGLGDRDRQDAALRPHAPRDGSVRAGVLVGTIARGTLQDAVVAPDLLYGGPVRGGDAGMEAQPRGPGAL